MAANHAADIGGDLGVVDKLHVLRIYSHSKGKELLSKRTIAP